MVCVPVCVCVCLCVVCMHVCLGTMQFLHLGLQATRPTHYAVSDFYRPFSDSCDIPHKERHAVELFACFGVRACVFLFCAKLTCPDARSHRYHGKGTVSTHKIKLPLSRISTQYWDAGNPWKSRRTKMLLAKLVAVRTMRCALG